MPSIVYGSINLKLCVMPYIAKIKNPSKARVRNPKFYILAQAIAHPNSLYSALRYQIIIKYFFPLGQGGRHGLAARRAVYFGQGRVVKRALLWCELYFPFIQYYRAEQKCASYRQTCYQQNSLDNQIGNCIEPLGALISRGDSSKVFCAF